MSIRYAASPFPPTLFSRPRNIFPSPRSETSPQTKEQQSSASCVSQSPSTAAPHDHATRQSHKSSASASPSSISNLAQRMSQTAQRSAVREQKLRSDPLVQVLGPTDVTCKRCGTAIKLSTKSSYDPFHWQRHIERCSKRPLMEKGSLKPVSKAREKVRARLFC